MPVSLNETIFKLLYHDDMTSFMSENYVSRQNRRSIYNFYVFDMLYAKLKKLEFEIYRLSDRPV